MEGFQQARSRVDNIEKLGLMAKKYLKTNGLNVHLTLCTINLHVVRNIFYHECLPACDFYIPGLTGSKLTFLITGLSGL